MLFISWERKACLELCVLLEAKKVSSVVLLLLDFALTQHNQGLILKAPAGLFLHSLGARQREQGGGVLGCQAVGCAGRRSLGTEGDCDSPSAVFVFTSVGSTATGKALAPPGRRWPGTEQSVLESCRNLP